MTTLGYFGDTPAQEEEAKNVLNWLWQAYPGHPWFVKVYQGGMYIKHLDFEGPWGMRAKFSQDGYSASALKHSVIMKAGEWLDRANIPRSRYDSDQEFYKVEGTEKKNG